MHDEASQQSREATGSVRQSIETLGGVIVETGMHHRLLSYIPGVMPIRPSPNLNLPQSAQAD
jgi:hypothetical protein